MKYLTILSAAFLWIVTPCLQALEPATERIVLLVSVDGLAHYYFDDPQAEMPNIRKLAAEGARAEKMLPVLPSVTWPNHTSIVTGVRPGTHGVLGNSYYDRKTNDIITVIWDPFYNKEEIVKVPTIYDIAKEAGLKTAAVTWPGSRGAKTLDWTVPCVNDSERFIEYSTPSLIEEFKKAGIPYENEAEGFKPARKQERDEWHYEQLKHILTTHRPNLVLHHILATDSLQHANGPQTPEAYAAIKAADGLIGNIWETLQSTHPGKATLILVSDHGFFGYRQYVRPNEVLLKAGLLTAEKGKITGGKVRALSQGGSSMIYILDQENREEIAKQVIALFKETEGIATVIEPSEMASYGLKSPTEMSTAADLAISAKEGYTFQDSAKGEAIVSEVAESLKGTHGYNPNEDRMHASFMAVGAGIKPGTKLGTVKNISVAPTIAKLLGLEMADVEGEVLSEILAP